MYIAYDSRFGFDESIPNDRYYWLRQSLQAKTNRPKRPHFFTALNVLYQIRVILDHLDSHVTH